QVICDAADAGTPVQEIYSGALQPAQIEIGRMWHRGEITVADEHFATATSEHVMSLLRPRFARAAPRDQRVLATAVSGDLHALGIRMVAEFLEMDGWDVIYLGANMPGVDLIRALAVMNVDLLALSATSFLNLRGVGELIEAIRGTSELASTKIIVGGAPFNLVEDLWRELGADGTAPSAAEAVHVATRLLGNAARS
ncbi:MAG: cobalamin B12-binding domain-containing protein, partial [Planctomycetota bacterium]